MDAKTRYRRRLRLQTALTRVLEVLRDNMADGIDPDPTTARMAAQVMIWLTPFIGKAGVDLEEELSQGPDLERFVRLIKARKKETHARKARSRWAKGKRGKGS
jgi:hypothetical protein